MREMLIQKVQAAATAARTLATLPTVTKNKILLKMADALENSCANILSANNQDLQQAAAKGIPSPMLDRLRLTPERISAIAQGVRQVADLKDPVGEIICGNKLPNGLIVTKVRVPLGVLGIIYESRPNVTADAIALALKSGNAVVMRGGSEAIHSNTAISKCMGACLAEFAVPEGAVTFIDTTDRQAVNILLKLHQYIDVIIPRGGAGLIQTVIENSSIPVIETGIGICHVFVDDTADEEMAENIIINAKTSRPAVCNAIESLLVHQDIAESFLSKIIPALQTKGVLVQGCAQCLQYDNVVTADDECYAKENLDLVISVKVVNDIHAAIEHIARFGSKHSESIITQNYTNAQIFQQQVDAAVVYVNASTRFTDGFEFGFGAEIGISTQKLHARGPMGLTELTSVKYLVNGDGQIR